MDFRPARAVPVHALCSIDVSQGGSHHRRVLANLFRVCLVSRQTVFVPEPGISRSLCAEDQRGPKPNAKLELVFVGGLIPCKACDLALRAAAPLLRNGSARLTILGDGPERNRLEQLVASLGIGNAVDFRGWVNHADVFTQLRSADVMLFPSVRDFGAGVVFEALACGAVPVVADFGGPGDIVHPGVGFKIPLINESDFVAKMESILTELAQNRDQLDILRRQGMVYAKERLTWEAKAQDTTCVLQWVCGRGAKPDFLPPKSLAKNTVQSQRDPAPYAGSPSVRA